MYRILLLFFLIYAGNLPRAISQGGFTHWITGDTSDFSGAATLPGLVLAGGGGDNDEAMQWMLQRGGGGDVVVLRASGSDGYNNYFFSQLGINVHSVETIRFDGPEAAQDPYVLRRIQEAEVLFLAGGDQYDYYQYWKDNAVEDAINYLLLEKKITVGGTSAGMAVLGQVYYTPSALGVIAAEALGNPYHPYMDIIGYHDFLRAPFMENVITDTHFDQRNRAGRTMAFLARMATDHGVRPFGIACNEYTAVCIDENGLARAFGEYPQFEEDLVYFLRTDCEPADFQPETCVDGMPLHWYKDQKAIKAYVVPGLTGGDNYLDLNDWLTGEGGSWQDWYVDQGVLFQLADALPPSCFLSFENAAPAPTREPLIFPNPFTASIQVHTLFDQPQMFEIRLLDAAGRVWLFQDSNTFPLTLDTAHLPAGAYLLEMRTSGKIHLKKLIKMHAER